MENEILSLETANWLQHTRGNALAWADIGTEDVAYIDPNLVKPVSGKAELRAYQGGEARPVVSSISEYLQPRVVSVDSAAILTYVCNLADTDGKVAPWNISRVYANLDGEWKLAHSHLSMIDHHQPDWVEIPLPVSPGPIAYTGLLAEVMALEHSAMQRWRQGDPWGFIENSAEDVTYFDTGTPQRVDGRAALSDRYKTIEGKIHYEVMEFVDPQVQVYGDLAILYYRFLSTCLQPEGSIKSRMAWNCTEVLSHIDGSWKTRHNHWSLIKGIKINK